MAACVFIGNVVIKFDGYACMWVIFDETKSYTVHCLILSVPSSAEFGTCAR